MRWRAKLPALAWLGLTAFINVLLIWGVIDYNLSQAERIAQQERQERIEIVEAELAHALKSTIRRLNENSQRLASWEETLAQFSDPSYYFFWLENSLPGSSFWLPVTSAIQLYRMDGNRLTHLKRLNEHLLPDHIPPDEMQRQQPFSRILADSHANMLFYQRFVPVHDSHNTLIGWLGVAYDLFEAMRIYYLFEYLSVSQLKVPSSGEYLPERLGELIKIQHRPDRLAQRLLQQVETHAFAYAGLLLLLLLINGLLSWYLFYRPVRKLYEAVLKADPLQPLKQLPTLPVEELEKFRHALIEAHEKQKETLEKLRNSSKRMQAMALVDPVTGLYNRNALGLHVDSREQTLSTLPGPLAFVIMDIAHFRAINDTYGPQVGDAVLEEVARELEALKETVQHLKLYRLGGDEFVLLFGGLASEAINLLLRDLAERIAELDLTEHGIHQGIQVRFGVVMRDQPKACELHMCLSEADIALMTAKEQNRPVQIFHETMRERCLLLDTEAVSVIEEAVNHGTGLDLYRQPIIRPGSRTILYHELLVRLHHGNRLIQPGALFQVIDRRHWHILLDRQVIEKARTLLLQGEIPPGEGISINLSGPTLMAEDLSLLLAPLSPWLATHTIVVEVLETYLIDDRQQVTAKLQALRKQGFKIALDDFGSGHASIAYLAELPVDIIKLDRSLTLRLGEQDSRQGTIIRSIVLLLHHAGYRVVLEGIENEQLCLSLCNLPIDGLQGFLFARPAPRTLRTEDIHQTCQCPKSSH